MKGWSFVVLGQPAPQGSKHGFVNPKTKRVIIVENSAKVRPWREAVKAVAPDGPKLEGPVALRIVFTVPRPQSARKLFYPATRPDLDKLTRSTMDAISDAGLWKDDAQVAFLETAKVWPQFGDYALHSPGAVIAAVELNGQKSWRLDLDQMLFESRSTRGGGSGED